MFGPWVMGGVFFVCAVLVLFVPGLKPYLNVPLVVSLTLGMIGFALTGFWGLSLRRFLNETSTVTRHLGQVGGKELTDLETLSIQPSYPQLLELVIGVNRFISAAQALHRDSFEAVGANRMLARELQRVWQLLDSLSEGVIILDAVGNVVFASKSSADYLDTPPGALAGKRGCDYVKDKTLGDFLRECSETGAVRPQVNIDLSEESLPVSKNVTVQFSQAINKNDVLLGSALLFKDVSRIRAAESVQISLLDNLSWTLRGRLSALAGHATQLGSSETTEEEGAKLRSMIEEESGHFTELLDRLVENAKIATGMIRVSTHSMPLEPLLEERLAAVRGACEEKGIELTSELPERLPSINVDKKYFDIALDNLLDNAKKYTPRGGSILLTAKSHETDFHICVRDTGSGISEEDLPGIMNRFSNKSDAERDANSGVGIGLNTALGIVRLHGGDIRVSSQLGQGSLFSIVLPRTMITMK